MTPLAHRIVKELTLPVKGRTFEDRCHLLKQMSDVHCFDVTEVIEQAEDLGRELSESGRLHTVGDLAFLPAPKTWIEWDTLSDQGRVGVLLQVTNDNIATGCWASASC